ncbi:MAG: microviridin/marinostatin family tricyclic proteinase inhibitor [Cyanobacteria bacterium J06635_10]
MSDNNNQEKNSPSVPFFARYLEGQFLSEVSEEEMDEVQGGLRHIDFKDIVVSRKYPSDHEDGSPGHGIITNKFRDIEDIGPGGGYVTKKYPSDVDEAVTMKWPSDGDDQLPTEFH